MSIEQVFGFIFLLLLIFLNGMVMMYVNGARYMGHGIYYLTINGWFRGNKDYREWLKENRVYHWCCLFMLALCPTILSLIQPFSRGQMLLRPEYMIYLNVFLWLCVTMIYRSFFNKKK